MTEKLHKFADLYRGQGPWCAAYVDAGAGTVDAKEAAEVRPGDVLAALAAQGAPPEDQQAMETAVDPAYGLPAPISRFVLVRQGGVELNELLPGPMVSPQQVSVDLVPDLLPLLKHRPEEFPYIVADVSREGGEIRLEYVGRPGPPSVEDVEGSTEDIHKVSGGIWGQDKMQRRTEEVWRRNAEDMAGQIDRVVDGSGARRRPLQPGPGLPRRRDGSADTAERWNRLNVSRVSWSFVSPPGEDHQRRPRH